MCYLRCLYTSLRDHTNWPEGIAFAAGLPNPDTLPFIFLVLAALFVCFRLCSALQKIVILDKKDPRTRCPEQKQTLSNYLDQGSYISRWLNFKVVPNSERTSALVKF